MNEYSHLLLAFGLILLNGFFVGAEFAMVRLRQTQVSEIEEENGLHGKILGRIHKKLDTYLSACQLGVTLASVGLGIVAEPAFTELLQPFVQKLTMSYAQMELITFSIAFILVSFFHIVIGELMPKSIAIRNSEMISIWTALPLYVFYWIMYPFIWVLNFSANLLLRVLGLHRGSHEGDGYSTDEIKLIVNSSYSRGELTADETEIIENTLEFADLRVTEVMRSDDELLFIDLDTPIDRVMQIIMEHRYSRYPVRDPKTGEIVGLIHIKDVFEVLHRRVQIQNMRSLLRPVIKVNHRVPAIEVLRKFRECSSHFALIYRGNEMLGYVTLDDLLHVLFGKISDEFNRTSNDYVQNADGSFVVEGDCSIYSLEQKLDIEIEDNEKYMIDNIGELIVLRIGYLPAVGEKISLEWFDVEITEVSDSEILNLILRVKTIEQEQE